MPLNSIDEDCAQPMGRQGGRGLVLRALYLSLLMVLPSVWAMVGADTSDLKRSLREFPEWTLLDQLDPRFHRAVADALADRLGGRRLARKTSAFLSRALGDDLSSSVVVGKEGWLFFEESLRLMTRTDQQPIKRRRAIKELRRRVTASNREFRLVIAPNKATLYPNKLPTADQRRWQRLAEPKLERFRRLMTTRPVDGFVEIGQPLSAIARLSQHPLYEPLGTHWVDEGALEAARLLVQSFEPELWSSARVVEMGEDLIDSDLLEIAGLSGGAAFPRLTVEVPGYQCEETYKEWTGPGLVRVFTSVADEELGVGSRVELLPPMILLHDSFGPKLGKLVAPFFERAVVLNYGAVWSPTARKMFEQSEIVIFEMAERYFFLASGETPTARWKDVARLLDQADSPIESASSLTTPSVLSTPSGP